MYLLAQMATYLFLSFLLGVWVGYALWPCLSPSLNAISG
jgi:cytochrome c biogenesis protein CcdA